MSCQDSIKNLLMDDSCNFGIFENSKIKDAADIPVFRVIDNVAYSIYFLDGTIYYLTCDLPSECVEIEISNSIETYAILEYSDKKILLIYKRQGMFCAQIIMLGGTIGIAQSVCQIFCPNSNKVSISASIRADFGVHVIITEIEKPDSSIEFVIVDIDTIIGTIPLSGIANLSIK